MESRASWVVIFCVSTIMAQYADQYSKQHRRNYILFHLFGHISFRLCRQESSSFPLGVMHNLYAFLKPQF